MQNAVFYHAGCPVCVSAEQAVIDLVDRTKFNLEVVHLGEHPTRVAEAGKAGVVSVPAMVLPTGVELHINHGADLSALAN